jgi:hypothetical protein
LFSLFFANAKNSLLLSQGGYAGKQCLQRSKLMLKDIIDNTHILHTIRKQAAEKVLFLPYFLQKEGRRECGIDL